MSNASKINPLPRIPYALAPERHTIRLHGDGHVLDDMELLETYEGERTRETTVDKVRLDMGVLKSNGGCEFRTPKGKKLFLQFSEFSFLFRAA